MERWGEERATREGKNGTGWVVFEIDLSLFKLPTEAELVRPAVEKTDVLRKQQRSTPGVPSFFRRRD